MLSAASRREMIRRHWRDPHSSLERYYGLGTISGSAGGWDWFGHSGGLQGYITRTAVLPRQDLALSVLTNAIDGLAHCWLDGAIHILRAFARHGAPARALRDWSGRWWTLWSAIDLVPIGEQGAGRNAGAFQSVHGRPPAQARAHRPRRRLREPRRARAARDQ